eukprot:m.632350 g.632350  ORF g.632350 m.632350 type:complete len:86 (+) comp58291_c0_seq3:794-1051(+)
MLASRQECRSRDRFVDNFVSSSDCAAIFPPCTMIASERRSLSSRPDAMPLPSTMVANGARFTDNQTRRYLFVRSRVGDMMMMICL